MQTPQCRSCDSAAEDLELPPEEDVADARNMWLLWFNIGSCTGHPLATGGGAGVGGVEAPGMLYVAVDSRSSDDTSEAEVVAAPAAATAATDDGVSLPGMLISGLFCLIGESLAMSLG